MDYLIDLILDAIAFVVLVVIYLVVLAFELIEDWFNDYNRTHTINTNELGFTIMGALEDPETPVVSNVFKKKVTYQGVYDKQAQKITDARKIESDSVDPHLASIHGRKKVALYT